MIEFDELSDLDSDEFDAHTEAETIDRLQITIGDELTADDFNNLLDNSSDLVDMMNDCAMMNGDWARVIAFITKESASAMDETFGNLPLHYGCANGAPLQVISALLEVHPDGAKCRDWQGKLPLHLALDCDSVHVETVESLLKVFPSASHTHDDNGLLPIEHGIKRGVPLEVLKAVVLAELSIAHPNQFAIESALSWPILIGSDILSIASCIEVVKVVFSSLPSMVHRLVRCKDKRGREVMSIARPEVKRFINKYLFFCGRYELALDRAPLHVSDTSIVIGAVDHQVTDDYASHIRQCLRERDNESQRLSKKEALACLTDMQTKGFDLSPHTLTKLGNGLSGQMSNVGGGGGIDVSPDEEPDIDIDGLVRLCTETWGSRRRVAIKFMKHKTQFIKESGTLM